MFRLCHFRWTDSRKLKKSKNMLDKREKKKKNSTSPVDSVMFSVLKAWKNVCLKST